MVTATAWTLSHMHHTRASSHVCALSPMAAFWGGCGPTTFTVIPFGASLKTLNYLSFHSDTTFPSYQTNYFPLCRCQWVEYRSSAWIISAHRSRFLWVHNWIFLHIVCVHRRMSFTRIPFCFIIAHCKRECMLGSVENGWHQPFHRPQSPRHPLHVLAIQQMEDERAHAPILSIQRRWRWKMWEDPWLPYCRWLSSLSLSFLLSFSEKKKQQTLC